jgi:hypothetical protein
MTTTTATTTTTTTTMTTTPGLLMNDYEHDGNMSPLGATAYAV